jgi:hypothetical protein
VEMLERTAAFPDGYPHRVLNGYRQVGLLQGREARVGQVIVGFHVPDGAGVGWHCLDTNPPEMAVFCLLAISARRVWTVGCLARFGTQIHHWIEVGQECQTGAVNTVVTVVDRGTLCRAAKAVAYERFELSPFDLVFLSQQLGGPQRRNSDPNDNYPPLRGRRRTRG